MFNFNSLHINFIMDNVSLNNAYEIVCYKSPIISFIHSFFVCEKAIFICLRKKQFYAIKFSEKAVKGLKFRLMDP